jgi:hypothetical protein
MVAVQTTEEGAETSLGFNAVQRRSAAKKPQNHQSSVILETKGGR